MYDIIITHYVMKICGSKKVPTMLWIKNRHQCEHGVVTSAKIPIKLDSIIILVGSLGDCCSIYRF